MIYTILDYADGYMARMYNMMSEFGDIYDHARDIIFHLFILNVIYKNKYLVSLFVIGVVLSLNSFGCQEIIYEADCKNKTNNTIGWLKPLCTNNKALDTFNKYIGSGSIYLFNILVMYCD
jgi:phosphatidylglycerophosphate synthase